MAEVSAVVAVMSVQPTSDRRTVLHASASPAAAAPVITVKLAPSANKPSKALSFMVIFVLPMDIFGIKTTLFSRGIVKLFVGRTSNEQNKLAAPKTGGSNAEEGNETDPPPAAHRCGNRVHTRAWIFERDGRPHRSQGWG